MAAGSFTVDLIDGTPESVKALVDTGFARVLVTQVRVDADAMTAAELSAVALYAGVFRRWSEKRTRFEGAGLAVLLGDEDGKGNLYPEESKVTARPLYDGSNNSWLRNQVLRTGTDGANGITVGTIASSATPTKKGTIDAGDTQRDVLDFACDVFTTSGSNPYEWRIAPAGTLDVALRNTLFPTTATPTVVVSPSEGAASFDSSVRWLPVDRWDPAGDWEDYATAVTVAYEADDYEFGEAYVSGDTVVASDGTYYRCILGHTSSGANLPPNATYWVAEDPWEQATTATDFVGLDGSDLIMERLDTLRNPSTSANASAVATKRLGRVDDMHRSLEVSTPAHDVRSWVAPGDGVYVYDPDAGLVDLSVEVDDGVVVHPLVTRVAGMRWPITEGMGVYVSAWNGSSFVVTDVSEFVAFGSGSAQLDVGEPRRTLPRQRLRWRPA